MELRIWPLASVLVLLCYNVLSAQAQTSDPLSVVPQCGVFCLAGSLNVSSCAQFNYNQTCLCGDETYNAAVTSCVLSSCTVKESLVTKNATQASCGIPIRDRSHALYLVTSILAVLTAVVVMVRLGFRLLVSKTGLYPDDWAILGTFLVGIAGTVFITTGSVPNGVGRDLWALTPAQITNFGMWFWASEVEYFITVSTLKLSLLLFYLRIFPSVTVRRLLWATVAFDVLYGLAFLLAALLQCRPVSFFWTKWDGEHRGFCANINAVGWANAIISIILDLWMLALPLSQLRSLRLHWKKKVGVGLMFFVGTFVTVISIVRLQSLVSFANSANLTYDNWDVNLWSAVEINIGIVCACMPTMRQVLAWYFPQVFGSGSRSRPGRYIYQDDGRDHPHTSGGSSSGHHHRHHHRHHYHERGFNKMDQHMHDGGGSGGGRSLNNNSSNMNFDFQKRAESRTGLTTTTTTTTTAADDNTTVYSPTSTLQGSGNRASPFPRSSSRSNGVARNLNRTPSLEDIQGIRVERSFYVDQSSLEEGRANTPLELMDLNKYPPEAYRPGKS